MIRSIGPRVAEVSGMPGSEGLLPRARLHIPVPMFKKGEIPRINRNKFRMNNAVIH